MSIQRWMKSNATRLLSGAAICMGITSGCEKLLTEAPDDGDLFEAPLPNLTRELQIMFNRGDENFKQTFTVQTGLGPLFNNASCISCHPGDGRGPESVTFLRFTEPGGDPLKNGEPQLQQFAIPGVTPEQLPAGSLTSPRTGPPVFGVGLIESIPEATILANEDPADIDADGISGRANMVTAPAFVPASEIGGGPGLHVGRFGLKANNASLLAQTVGAYLQDMGITSAFASEEIVHPLGNGITLGDNVADPEISAATVQQTVMYIRLLSPPARGPITTEVQQGELVFNSMNCQSCHVPTMTTGNSAIPQLSNVPVNLYSDLLLHDMGPELADGRPDQQATGFEWKTRPLWGLRLVGDFLGGHSNFMHDGRASTLDAAIRLHGGEAQTSRDSYTGLGESEKQALIAFLNSL